MTQSEDDRRSPKPDPPGRRWRLWVLVAALILAFVAVRWFLPGPELTLAFLKVLVWPSVLVGVLYALRERLLEKFGDLVEWAGFGQSLKFREDAAKARTFDAEERLGDALLEVRSPDQQAEEEPVASVAEAGSEPPPAAGPAAPETAPEDAEVGAPDAVKSEPDSHGQGGGAVDTSVGRFSERERRRAVERAFSEGAAWGYDMAQIGFRSRPRPVIEWTPGGHPIIQYGVGTQHDPRSDMDSATRRRVEDLEQEIRRLDVMIENPRLDSIDRVRSRNLNAVRDRRYHLAKDLRELDPDSPLLPR